MHFLVLGASGFIGRHIVAELIGRGHLVTGAGRDTAFLHRIFPAIRTLRLDIAALPDDLAARLESSDVIVNCAGLLEGEHLAAVHVEGPAKLYAAALVAGVRRIILISAISAREDVATAYSKTKLQGEHVLKEQPIAWTVLRPSLVVAKGSYGGTSVLRGLAGLPFVTPIIRIGDGRLSPIHADDLARIVADVASDDRFAGATLEPCGPETFTIADLVRRYRAWLGFATGMELPIAAPLVRFVGRIGDLLGGGPMSTVGLAQLAAGNAGDAEAFAKRTGFQPRGLEAILSQEPATVQDRWHARLFFLGILARTALIVLWVASAVGGLANGAPSAAQFLATLHLPVDFGWPLTLVTSVADLVVAALLLFERSGRWALGLQLVLVVGYTVTLGVVLPELWADPFGDLLKNVPILVLIGINAVCSETR